MNAYVEIFLVFVLPVVLWALNIIPTKFRAGALTAMSLLVAVFVILEHWSWQKLGIRTDNLALAFLPYLIMAIVSLFFMWGFAKFKHRRFIWSWKVHPTLWFFVTAGSIMQEFVYRGYLIPKLAEVTSSIVWIILINAFLYMLAHIIYPEIRTNLPLVFVGGIMFASMYWYYPNLIWISALHMLLNFTAGCFGFFTLNPEVHEI